MSTLAEEVVTLSERLAAYESTVADVVALLGHAGNGPDDLRDAVGQLERLLAGHDHESNDLTGLAEQLRKVMHRDGAGPRQCRAILRVGVFKHPDRPRDFPDHDTRCVRADGHVGPHAWTASTERAPLLAEPDHRLAQDCENLGERRRAYSGPMPGCEGTCRNRPDELAHLRVIGPQPSTYAVKVCSTDGVISTTTRLQAASEQEARARVVANFGGPDIVMIMSCERVSG